MEKFSASTHNDDLRGNIAIDEDDMKNIFDFAKDNGIDLEKYIPVGISFWKSPKDEEPLATVITIDAAKLNQGESFENLKLLIDRNDPVPVKKFDLDVGISEFFKYCSRVSICISRLGNLMDKEISH